MPEYYYIAYAAGSGECSRYGHELIAVSPFAWLLDVVSRGYEDAPYVMLHSFPITEAEYTANRLQFL